MSSKMMYKFKNIFKSKEQRELEARMMFNKQQREFNQYYKDLGASIKRYEKMAEESARSGNHQNALSCAKFVLKLRKTQVRVQGLLQRFEMMRSMQQLSNVMSNFMASCAEMGMNMNTTINLKDMWKNTAMMDQSLAKLDAMSQQMDEVFNTIDNGLRDDNSEMETEEDMETEASELLDQIMGRYNDIHAAAPARTDVQDEKNQAAQPVENDDVSERLRKMMEDLKD